MKTVLFVADDGFSTWSDNGLSVAACTMSETPRVGDIILLSKKSLADLINVERGITEKNVEDFKFVTLVMHEFEDEQTDPIAIVWLGENMIRYNN